MNSLSDLNNFSSQGTPYQDDRSFHIEFSAASATNQSVSISEGDSHAAEVGIDITALYATSNNVSYSINVSSAHGTVEWPSPLPYGITTSNVGYVHTAHNITGKSIWNLIKNANIHMERDFANNWSYTSTITYTGGSKSWTTNVTVADLSEITSTTSFTFDQAVPVLLTGTPQIVDAEDDGIFTMNVAANSTAVITSLSSTGVGGTSTFNGSTKVLTISGYRDEVNSHLGNITFSPSEAWRSNVSINYTLTNPTNSITTTISQPGIIANLIPYMSNLGVGRSYTQNHAAKLFTSSIPQITSNAGPTFRVDLTISSDIGRISSNGDFRNWSDFNTNTLTYSYSGTKDAVNAEMANVYFIPNKNTTSNVTVVMTEYADSIYQGSNVFALTGTAWSGNLGVGTYTFTPGTHTFTPTFNQIYYCDSEVLAIAGGGAGGIAGALPDGFATVRPGGGGGAGGLYKTPGGTSPFYNTMWHFFNSTTYNNQPTYTIGVGSKGTGSYTTPSGLIGTGKSGTDTYLDEPTQPVYPRRLTITGGGGGGRGAYGSGAATSGLAGGSGGGGGGSSTGVSAGAGGSGVSGQGYAGEGGSTNGNSGGGGGAGAVGAFHLGGAGYTSAISGSSIEYAKGGSYNTSTSTPGSGGSGYNGAGQDGIVIIKIS